MTDNIVFQKAMEVFKVPKTFYDVAMLMYEPYEQALAAEMQQEIWEEKTILSWLLRQGFCEKQTAEELLFHSYQRYVCQKAETENGNLGYEMLTFYDRLPAFAQYEEEVYKTLSDAQVEELNHWDLKEYVERNKETVLAIKAGEDRPMHQSHLLTLSEADQTLEKMGKEILVIPCNCKALGRCTEKPVNVCMNPVEDGWNTLQDRRLGQKMSLEEAKQHIRKANRQGLMQWGEEEALCNCDGKYCYPFKMAEILDTKGIYPKAYYEIQWHEEKCIQCGKCVKICNFHAFTKNNEKKISFHADRCRGCTICYPNCPKQAISLNKI